MLIDKLLEKLLQLFSAIEVCRKVQPLSQAPPNFLSLAVWKSRKEPGIIYQIGDVEGREKVERT